MKKGVSTLLLALAVAAIGAFVPAHANSYCNSSVVIFSAATVDLPSNPAGVDSVSPGSINENAASCAVDNSDEIYDTRFINPGSNSITVRDTAQLDASVQSLPAVLNGLGFTDYAITLTRGAFTAGLASVYDSPVLMLPDGFAAAGSITATVTLPDGTTDSTTFHTVGS